MKKKKFQIISQRKKDRNEGHEGKEKENIEERDFLFMTIMFTLYKACEPLELKVITLKSHGSYGYVGEDNG